MTWLRSTWEKSSVLKSEKEGVSLFISMINESINQSLSLTCMCACVHTCMGTCTHSFRLYMKPEQIWSQQRWESGQEGRVQKVPEGQKVLKIMELQNLRILVWKKAWEPSASTLHQGMTYSHNSSGHTPSLGSFRVKSLFVTFETQMPLLSFEAKSKSWLPPR